MPVRSPERIKAPVQLRAPEMLMAPKLMRTPGLVMAPEIGRTPELMRTPKQVRTSEMVRTPELVRAPELVRTPELVGTPELARIRSWAEFQVAKGIIRLGSPPIVGTARNYNSVLHRWDFHPLYLAQAFIATSFSCYKLAEFFLSDHASVESLIFLSKTPPAKKQVAQPTSIMQQMLVF